MMIESSTSFFDVWRTRAAEWMKTPKKFSVIFAGLSDVGMSRAENQDCWGVFPKEPDSYYEQMGQLFIIADGMGGHARGSEASKLAVHYVPDIYFSDATDGIKTGLLRAFETANARILERWQESSESERMGTTCSALVLSNEGVFIAHVGDSRIYRVSNNKIVQLTADHTYVAELFRQGILTKEEAKDNPRRSELTRAVGVQQELEVDIIETLPMRIGDIYVLCTDGLAHVSEEEIKLIVQNHDPEDACRELIDLENNRGGDDNITVQVINIEAASRELEATTPLLLRYSTQRWLGFATLFMLILGLGFLGYHFRNNISDGVLSLLFRAPNKVGVANQTSSSFATGPTDSDVKELEKWIQETDSFLQATLQDSTAIQNSATAMAVIDANKAKTRQLSINNGSTDISRDTPIRPASPAGRSAVNLNPAPKAPTKPIALARYRADNWSFPGLNQNVDYILTPKGFTLTETVGIKKAIFQSELSDFDFEVTVENIHDLNEGKVGVFVGYQRGNNAETFFQVYLKQNGEFALVKHYQNKRELLRPLEMQLKSLPSGPLRLGIRCVKTWIVVYANGDLINAWHNNNEIVKGKVGFYVGSEIGATFADIRIRPALSRFDQALK